MKYDPNEMGRLEEYRRKIDDIDHELMRLMGERFALVTAIKRLKEAERLPIVDGVRKSEIKENYLLRARELGISDSFAQDLFEMIHEESVRIQC